MHVYKVPCTAHGPLCICKSHCQAHHCYDWWISACLYGNADRARHVTSREHVFLKHDLLPAALVSSRLPNCWSHGHRAEKFVFCPQRCIKTLQHEDLILIYPVLTDSTHINNSTTILRKETTNASKLLLFEQIQYHTKVDNEDTRRTVYMYVIFFRQSLARASSLVVGNSFSYIPTPLGH